MNRSHDYAYFAFGTALVALSVATVWGGGVAHVAAPSVLAVLVGIAGVAMACVMGYSAILGFASGPLAYFAVRVRQGERALNLRALRTSTQRTTRGSCSSSHS